MSVTLTPTKDNTLYQDTTGSLSNGAGMHLFVGATNQGRARRAVIAFDIASNLPAGARIQSVRLTLNMSRSLAGPQTVQLRRLLAGWGQGTSNAGVNEGGGAPATSGDATWLHRSHDTQLWETPGGDIAGTISASVTVAGLGSYTWESTSQMVTDVQGRLTGPANNFGWLLLGNEAQSQTAKRFDSLENPTPANRPMLVIEYFPS